MDREQCDFNKDGYLQFKNGYIGHIDGDVLWCSDLERLKKKTNPIIDVSLIKSAYELKKDLENV